jgi:V/A-type H+-transporting ATPase subunit I
VADSIEEAKTNLAGSERVSRFEGWVPRRRLRDLASELGAATAGRAALRAFAPYEVERVRSGEEEVPVLLKKRFFFSSFERLVLSYGTPLYGTVDPTPFVAFFFVLLFSIMFGDAGQGFLIMCAGILLRLGHLPALRKWKAFGPILVGAGIGSMAMGFLTGTTFANEERSLSAALLGRPVDRFLTLMPSGGVEKILAFFGFTLGIGAVVNSLGLIFNIVNKLRTGRVGEAFFSKTGLVGAAFFWWSAGIAVRAATGGSLAWFDILGLGLPLLGLMFEEPLARLVDGRREEGDGAFAFAVKCFVGFLEAISYYISNSLSFLRVGAFALSHAVLSFIVFALATMVRDRAGGGFFWEILVVVIGNAIILVLEGMIVAIQVVRLQYYEFLSKFLTETGRPFAPFKFAYRKE